MKKAVNWVENSACLEIDLVCIVVVAMVQSMVAAMASKSVSYLVGEMDF